MDLYSHIVEMSKYAEGQGSLNMHRRNLRYISLLVHWILLVLNTILILLILLQYIDTTGQY